MLRFKFLLVLKLEIILRIMTALLWYNGVNHAYAEIKQPMEPLFNQVHQQLVLVVNVSKIFFN